MIRFREMRPEDAEAVEIIEKASFAMPWPRKAFWEEASNERTYYVVALEAATIVGYAGMWVLGDEAQVTNVAVAPERRGQGVGSGLMGALFCEARARGAARITLEVRPSNLPAIALYEKYGFAGVGRRPRYYLDNGEDALIMWNMRL